MDQQDASTNSAPEVSVVIPSFNEEADLARNVRALVAALDGWDCNWELILVDDGSTDGTAQAQRELAGEYENVHSVSYTANRGRGYALRRGIDAARGALIVTTEADLTWGMDIVPRLVHALLEGDYDLVVASPYRPGGRLENVPWGRALISRWGNRLLAATFPGRVTMLSGMTRAYRREVLEGLVPESEGKEFHLEVLFKAAALGYRIGEIPAVLRWEQPVAGARTRRSTFRVRRVIATHMLMWMAEKPMWFIGVLGVLWLGVGLGLGVYLTVLWLTGDLNPVRPLLTLTVICVLGGCQLLAFGFMGLLISKLRNDITRTQRESRAILKKIK